VDDNAWWVSRAFGPDKEITVVHIYAPGPDAVVEMPVPIDEGYQVIPGRGPTRGKWDRSPDPSSMSSTYTVDSDPHLNKDRDDGYSDRFILGTNLEAVWGFYQKMVAVDVVIESTVFR
jgi:hypothetical protein